MGRDAETWFTSPGPLRNGAAPPLKYRVLASGSGGNCSIVCAAPACSGAAILVDLGLSRRRTRLELERAGLGLDAIDAVALTHLDSDHCQPLWTRCLPARTRVLAHRAHARQARALGWSAHRLETFDDSEALALNGVVIRARLASHDRIGVAAFRIACAGAELGHATDIGRPTDALARFLKGVDALGLESNYCPIMQLKSSRPALLKRRIMGGAGHLSNEQSAEMVARIKPRSQVVLLHLSRQCNRPEIALSRHAAHGVPAALSWQHKSTPWFAVRANPAPDVGPSLVNGQLPLHYRTVGSERTI